MEGAVRGKELQVRGGGSTDVICVADVARALLAAADSRLEGARVYNLHGASAAIRNVVKLIGRAWPSADGLISHVEQPMPFPAALDDTRYQKNLGPAPATTLDAGVRTALDEYARLQPGGRLDARELARPGRASGAPR